MIVLIKPNKEFFEKWFNRHTEKFEPCSKGEKPSTKLFYYKNGEKQKEDSVHLEHLSKCFQNRGYLRKDEFLQIRMWKSTRGMKGEWGDITKIKPKRVRSITETAMELDGIKQKISVLTSIKGIDVKSATAYLAVFDPDKYCVFDVRVWQTYREIQGEEISIEQAKRESKDIGNYKEFLDWVRDKAAEYDMSPRQIEVALWHYNKMGK